MVSRSDDETQSVVQRALLAVGGSLLASGVALGLASALARDPKAARSALGLVAGLGAGYMVNRARAVAHATKDRWRERALGRDPGAKRAPIEGRATVRAAVALVGQAPNERVAAGGSVVQSVAHHVACGAAASMGDALYERFPIVGVARRASRVRRVAIPE